MCIMSTKLFIDNFGWKPVYKWYIQAFHYAFNDYLKEHPIVWPLLKSHNHNVEIQTMATNTLLPTLANEFIREKPKQKKEDLKWHERKKRSQEKQVKHTAGQIVMVDCWRDNIIACKL